MVYIPFSPVVYETLGYDRYMLTKYHYVLALSVSRVLAYIVNAAMVHIVPDTTMGLLGKFAFCVATREVTLQLYQCLRGRSYRRLIRRIVILAAVVAACSMVPQPRIEDPGRVYGYLSMRGSDVLSLLYRVFPNQKFRSIYAYRNEIQQCVLVLYTTAIFMYREPTNEEFALFAALGLLELRWPWVRPTPTSHIL